MQFVVDILLIAAFALLVFQGLRRGFVKSILSLGRFVLSLVITILFSSDFANWINARFVNPSVYDSVSKRFSGIAADVAASADGNLEAFVEKIPRPFRGYLDLESIDPTSDINALADQWSHSVADGISKVISSVVGFVLLFLISFIVLSIVIFVVNKLTQLPIIKAADTLLGGVVGVFYGTVAVIVLSAILGAILGLMGQQEVVEQSCMLRLFAGVRDLIFE